MGSATQSSSAEILPKVILSILLPCQTAGPQRGEGLSLLFLLMFPRISSHRPLHWPGTLDSWSPNSEQVPSALLLQLGKH